MKQVTVLGITLNVSQEDIDRLNSQGDLWIPYDGFDLEGLDRDTILIQKTPGGFVINSHKHGVDLLRDSELKFEDAA